MFPVIKCMQLACGLLAIVALSLAYLGVRAIAGLFSPVRHQRDVVGSSAEIAAGRGGTKAEPMQA